VVSGKHADRSKETHWAEYNKREKEGKRERQRERERERERESDQFCLELGYFLDRLKHAKYTGCHDP